MNPLVSICCTTYNHEKYIHDTINGFIMQKTNFSFEILIHDDASTDKTADIIKKYSVHYSDLFLPIYQKINQYSQGIKPLSNFLFPRAKGKYIAFCEGDDYWTDPYKLQKQVDALERNNQIDICSHSVIKYDEDLQTYTGKAGNNGSEQRIIPIEEVITNFGIVSPMSSIMIRNIKIDEFVDLISGGVYGGHGIMQVLWAHPHGILYIPEPMSTYRVNSAGSVTKNILNKKEYYLKVLVKRIESFRLLDIHFNHEYKDLFSYKILEIKKNILRARIINFKDKINFLIKEKKGLNIIEILMLVTRGLLSKIKFSLLGEK